MNVFFYLWIAAQIIAESFPISSSGHQLLIAKTFSSTVFNNTALYHSIANILHLPTLCIVLRYFFPAINKVVRQWHIRSLVQAGLLLFIVDAITAIFYFFIIPKVTATIVLLIGFIMTTLLLLGVSYYRNSLSGYSYLFQAIILGVAQSCAFLPGISRLAITYGAACALGHSPANAFALSWLIVLPLFAAAATKSVITVANAGLLGQLLQPDILLVIIISSIVAWYGFVWFAQRAEKQQLQGIAGYMLLPILYTCLLLLQGK